MPDWREPASSGERREPIFDEYETSSAIEPPSRAPARDLQDGARDAAPTAQPKPVKRVIRERQGAPAGGGRHGPAEI